VKTFSTKRAKETKAYGPRYWSYCAAGGDSKDFLETSAFGIAARNLADSAETRPDTHIGRVIGSYTITGLIGSGGMGEVYAATDEKLRRKVALKLLPAEYTENDERVQRFQLEARAISALNHPNIVTIHDVGTINGVSFIATEFVEGRTIRDLIESGPKLREVLGIVIQCCEALEVAHAAGIIHRDIKPENMILRPDGYLKILDFGLVKLSDLSFQTVRNLAKTAHGVLIGTPAYMSPEQVADEKVDHRTDLWSLGVVLYELLTGVNPFKKDNRQATFQAILSEDPPLPGIFNPEVTAELDQIVKKALEKDADLSYQTASDLRADLKRIRREIDSSPSIRSGSTASVVVSAAKRRSLLIPALVTMIILAVAGFGVWWLYASSRNQVSSWNNAVVQQLTDFSGEESFPSLSPDGKTLVYTRKIKGNTDIFWQRINGSNVQNLTSDSTADDKHPAFSPNGEQIAFRSDRSGGGLFVMGATGESVKRLTDFGFNPAWSPSGDKIVFSTIEFVDPLNRGRFGELWTATLNGEVKRVQANVDALQPSYSPDGRFIVFWGNDEQFQRDLWTVPADGGEAVRLTDDDALDWNPIWSPDGSFIYFCSNRNGAAGIWRLAVDKKTGKQTGVPEAISATPAQSWNLTLSADGKNLVYSRRQRIENIMQADFDTGKLEIVGKPTAITEGTKRTRTPAVSPDGSLIAFYLTGEVDENIVVVKNGETKWNLITNDAARDRVPRFSPDGSRVYFYSNLTGSYEIHSVNVDGSERRQITFQGGKGAVYSVISPDGKRLAYQPFDESSRILDLETNWENQKPFRLPLFDDPQETFAAWSWSPDGKRLAGWKSHQTKSYGNILVVFSFDTNSYETIVEGATRPVWLADNRHLIAEADGSIALIDTVSKTKKIISASESQEMFTPTISSDNKRIVYSSMNVEGDIQMLSLK
jgi:serine/threonine protein kinase